MRALLLRCCALLIGAVALLQGAHAADAALVIDGVPDEALWDDATVYGDFKVTQPYTLEAPRHATQVRLLGTPQGIAIAFHCEQPASTPRRAERTARDADSDGDRVNVNIDFDADAKVAYNFMVTLGGALQDSTITNERQFSRDWDGQWQGAAQDHGDYWTAEFLIPWNTASMAGSGTPTRRIGVMFDRVIGAHQERSAWPAASFQRPRYMSEFQSVEIAQFQQASLQVFPYASLRSDQVHESLEGKVGLDLLWKPTGDFQLAASLNPDFGQVEADELVVNFDAIETFFSDKRPFFTENQGLFDVRTPDSGLLVYTRRIGGPRDDDPDRAADIDLALKINGRLGGTDYGVLTAFERDWSDDQTGAYLVSRLQRSVGAAQWGWLSTYADRPALDRRAMVQALDVNWRPNERWLLSGQVLGSFLEQQQAERDGFGAWVRGYYFPNAHWQHELELTHFDRHLNFNDLGFQRRASLNELEYTVIRRYNQFAAGDARRNVSWILEPQLRTNDQGDRLPGVLILIRESERVDGGFTYAEVIWNTAGFDDLVSRGHGLVHREPRLQYAELFRRTPKLGAFVIGGGLYAQQEGQDHIARGVYSEVRWLPRSDFNMELELSVLDSPDWLIWRDQTLFGSYERRRGELSLDANWFPAQGHELRAKLQWLGIDARHGSALRIAERGRLRPAPDVLEDFGINNFGLQLRYRWQIQPGTDLYAVYSRGGYQETRPHSGQREGLDDLFGQSFDLRDADQFLVKLRWGF